MTQSTRERADLDFLAGKRMRRTRQTGWSRAMVQETDLTTRDLILPLFILEGENQREKIATMPGVERLSIDLAIEVAKEARDLGIPALALFPCTQNDRRTEDGRESYNPDNLMCQALRAIKNAVPDIGLIADVALDPYTSHGHDGLMDGEIILNDESVAVLIKQALNQAAAGADIIAPSDMMDGRIGALREALDAEGYENVILLSYAAKFASAFYGPFRDAVGSGARLKGDKKTYQLEPFNREEALREVEQDLLEAADWVMIKPGMAYLDIVREVKDRFEVPVFAYQVSGEYAQIEFAAAAGALDRDGAMMESLIAFKRAGCSGILTYFALDAAKKIRG